MPVYCQMLCRTENQLCHSQIIKEISYRAKISFDGFFANLGQELPNWDTLSARYIWYQGIRTIISNNEVRIRAEFL
jgi:hypothetical protein